MGLSSLTGDQQLLLFTALGGIGLILGYLFEIIGSIGIIMVSSALFLSVPAWRDRDDSDWSKEVRAQCYALTAFGGMAAIGFGIRLWQEILT
ncbi:MAG: hypothetical protein V3U09_04195 [Thermoplasmata archaeon]